jgi:hypothetical protein
MDEETLTVWLDTALLMLGGFVLMTVLMMTVMNPPAKSSESAGVPAPGNVIIEAQWPDKLDANGPAEPLVATTVELRRENQELTALRFRLDGNGKLQAGSVNSLFKELRVASAQ